MIGDTMNQTQNVHLTRLICRLRTLGSVDMVDQQLLQESATTSTLRTDDDLMEVDLSPWTR